MGLEQEKSIFLHALEIDTTEERESYIRIACDGNEGLLDSIRSLLLEEERDNNPVDRSLMELLTSGEFGAIRDVSDVEIKPGNMIGPYKLMEQIGEGGFGLVFVADQQVPVRRRVAIKIIKPGYAYEQIISRFEAERQALAMMDHENISRVFDAGVTKTGQPYFVMELVRGVRLDEFCDNQKLNTTERLKLFLSICHAVQHAHQKGIIHRDLKPTNILVTMQDGRPIPKVIDFGLVKAIGEKLIDQTIYTRFAAMMGTPAYMSPEQAEMSNVDVDTRSDIYTLGVILYELLAGSTPFSSERLSDANFDELRCIIRDEEPPPPSVRLVTLCGVDVSTVSANRRVGGGSLSSMLKGDLDCIVMKALEKDRDRRYPSAAAMAKDISRFLNQEPVEARPPSKWYRFSKFARRNRAALVTATVITVSLLLATTVSAWQAYVAYNAMQQARESERIANDSRHEMEEFTSKLKRANALLIAGEAYVQSGEWSDAYKSFTEGTTLLPEYFSVWVERGSLLARLGLWEEAIADYTRAIDLGSPVDGIEFQGVPHLFYFFGKDPACRKLVEELARSKGGFPGTKLRGQLCGKTSPEIIARVVKESENLVNDQSLLPSGEPTRSSEMPYGAKLYVAGWAHLEDENYDQAIYRLSQSHTEVPAWKGLGIGFPLMAIAYYKSGQIDKAESALKESEDMLDRWLEISLSDLNGAPPMKWCAWIEFIIHFREAYQMIYRTLPVADPRFELQRRKAAAVLGI